MKTSEFMKLEQTALAEVIAEEEGNEQYKNLCALSKGKAPSLIGTKEPAKLQVNSGTDLHENATILSDSGGEKIEAVSPVSSSIFRCLYLSPLLHYMP